MIILLPKFEKNLPFFRFDVKATAQDEYCSPCAAYSVNNFYVLEHGHHSACLSKIKKITVAATCNTK